MKSYMITTHFDTKSKYDREWRDRENKAIVNAGFELVTVGSNIFGIEETDFTHLVDKHVAYRCYANQESMIEELIRHNISKPIMFNASAANDWYKSIDHDIRFFGRKIGHLNLRRFGYLEEMNQVREFEKSLRAMFDEFEKGGQVFVKSTTKSSFVAKLRDYKELLDEMMYSLGISCHNTPSELIFSNPMHIHQIDELEYDREEYRVFVIDAKPVTISLFTDNKADRQYSHVERFARKFAKHYENELPRMYCVDVARDVFNGLFIVELNGFGASGYFADHDLDVLFMKLKESIS